MAGDSISFVFYQYTPSMAAAVIFKMLFGISFIHHLILMVGRRTWFLIPFLIGALFETIGYIGRAMSSAQAPDFTENPYIIQSVLLLLGPTLLAASIYMMLGRLIRLLEADDYSLVKPTLMTKVFVTGDVLSFFTQSGGGGMMASAKSSSDVTRGEKIILAGLCIQILFFGFFMVAIGIFHRRLNAQPTNTSLSLSQPWKQLLGALYASGALIMVRSLFRVAEYASGSSGPLQSTEIYIYIFDAALMFFVVALFNVSHPSLVLGHHPSLQRATSFEVARGSYPLQNQSKYGFRTNQFRAVYG